MKYIIFGIPGVGKTSVVNEVVTKTSIKRINLGDLLSESAIELKLINHRDELRKLNFRQQYDIRDEVVKKLIKIHEEEGDILIETHAVINTPQGYWPGLDENMIKSLKPDTFIVIWADTYNLVQRRKSDATRKRDLDIDEEKTRLEIESSDRITKNMAQIYTVLSGGTYLEVENKQGEMNYAVDIISEIILKGKN